ncbi:RING finger protein 150-like [Phalaenopsis equestris]|uniref:RING finger protein 150-like n=1 Tax=Phalaenopsis equestris TaxID=78828 RepID=UPI0009E384A9|nr:RING finger protein 150-like [Phalaenopsis equestris]
MQQVSFNLKRSRCLRIIASSSSQPASAHRTKARVEGAQIDVDEVRFFKLKWILMGFPQLEWNVLEKIACGAFCFRWMRSSAANAQANSRQVHASHGNTEVLSLRNSGTGKRAGELTRRSSKTDICAVCLDGFRVQQKVIWLPCAHRYHSSCVLPWLADHSHCPYCRTEVPSLELRSSSVL